jgi:hypothetical protein
VFRAARSSQGRVLCGVSEPLTARTDLSPFRLGRKGSGRFGIFALACVLPPRPNQPCRHPSIRTLSERLLRSVQVGCSRFSRCCHLFVIGGGSGDLPFASRLCRCVNRVGTPTSRIGFRSRDHSVPATHSAIGATARPQVGAGFRKPNGERCHQSTIAVALLEEPFAPQRFADSGHNEA